MSLTVVVWKRDLKTWKLGDFAASVGVPGQITCVAWDEQYVEISSRVMTSLNVSGRLVHNFTH
jgi:hypothetical protein